MIDQLGDTLEEHPFMNPERLFSLQLPDLQTEISWRLESDMLSSLFQTLESCLIVGLQLDLQADLRQRMTTLSPRLGVNLGDMRGTLIDDFDTVLGFSTELYSRLDNSLFWTLTEPFYNGLMLSLAALESDRDDD